jgi:hypothetical protein
MRREVVQPPELADRHAEARDEKEVEEPRLLDHEGHRLQRQVVGRTAAT